jgi:beta-lactamase superfamily II metal-dependent hydrolase
MPTKKINQRKMPATRTASTAAKSGGDFRIKVRMYRQGLGDCFLITIPKKDNGNGYILIDCGVVLGTPEPATKMQAVVNDILATTGGKLDVLIATHAHWDHLSGFLQAQELFQSKFQVAEVWLAWTEDLNDPLASELRATHNSMRASLAAAAARMHLSSYEKGGLDSVLEFFGAKGQGTTSEALEVVKGLCDPKKVRYCRPSDPPATVAGMGAKFYVLGPPHDKKMIMTYNPSKADPETYGLSTADLLGFQTACTDSGIDAPFDDIQQISMTTTKSMSFFQEHYWGADAEGEGQSWRRIDSDWLEQATGLALQLDNATNNTSLALAIELENGDVLLFAADAQVGNWLSWQNLRWTVDGKEVTGPGLLRRTVIYKTGHHGSHNATLKEKGLEEMDSLQWALIPVDHDMAVKKRWGNMPLDEIVKVLGEKTKGRVLRIDQPPPAIVADVVGQDAGKSLYYEVTI